MIYYFALFIITLIIGGGLFYTLIYYIVNQIYDQTLPIISGMGGLSPEATLSNTFLSAVLSSFIILLFIVGWIWLFTKYQRRVGYGE